jgi:hypothetical protein
MMMSEYVTRFMQLSRYAPNDVDTDEKTHGCFLKGLEDGLAYALEARDFKNFQTMVDKALVLENTNPRPHVQVNSLPARPIFRPVPQSSQPMPRLSGQGLVTPQ